ncbi:LuxE/PaaK family acyltransferase [Candidatus Ponderosibacter sp. Uisw_141_02]|uniref:LuxE/PaaK family acyltransferase n=1 Tax=Candidatus Ponderosibacter sp. Uisw_141_02 TaxID=3231000 RepID=UPI003D49D846
MIVKELSELTQHHRQACDLYRHYVDSMFPLEPAPKLLSDLPYLPVRAFKEHELKSVLDSQVYKVMRSSGTSGHFSKIFLDKRTAQLQTRALVDGFADYFGKGRFPMLIIDNRKTVADRNFYSARTAAINGFSMFSRGQCFALDDDMEVDFPAVKAFLRKYEGTKIFIFGFTSIVWSKFIQTLAKQTEALDLSNAFLLHGGGWKKLESEKISNDMFKEKIRQMTECEQVHNYYGMVEQTGTIFMECESGNMHASAGADVLIRDPASLDVLDDGEPGLIQVFSAVQLSYPGHSILTEDVGQKYDGASCSCGRSGSIVNVLGRMQHAELRGCSDAYS